MIGKIENAVIQKIKSADLGYHLKLVESYKAQFDDDLVKLVKTSAPAVWVAFTGEDNTQNTAKGMECTASFSIIILTRNVRNERSARFGDKQGEVGTYQILQDIKALLHGSDVGLNIVPFEHKRTVPLLNTAVSGFFASVFALEFETSYVMAAADKTGGDLAEFLRLHADWELPEFNSETLTNIRGKNE